MWKVYRPPWPESNKLVPYIPSNIYNGNRPSQHPMLRWKSRQVLYLYSCLLTLSCRWWLLLSGLKYPKDISRIRILSNNLIMIEQLYKYLTWMIWLNKETEFESRCKIFSTMNAHWTIYVNHPKRHSRGILQHAKGDCSDRVDSDQMVLGTVRQEAGPRERWPQAPQN